ncbi:MAG: hypothetical protein JWO90_2003 [Solirubrobacterales bacterium]|jgi:NAD(P)-dependent dehydrogenase (short-subunit alcohol dehydrogenase family)|nr:hypothetical protein [Solirubrobacterales bacterium]
MSTNKPVVVYGASGFTGRLVCEFLREHGLGFVAAGRDAARVQEVMDRNVPGIETADYEVAAVDHDVESLTELFTGARVVCNMVGPFAKYGHEAVQAALAAGCHYTDTNGEQSWMIECEEQYGAAFAEAGLLLSPGIAQMYTTGEIAANIALETPGLDTLDLLVLWKGFPTTASTQTIFTTLASEHFYLEDKEYRQWAPETSFSVSVPGQHTPAIVLPWGGTAHPVWFKRDPRVATCRALGGVADQGLMAGVVQMTEAIAAMPKEEQGPALEAQAAATEGGMPPRENQRSNWSLDSVHASGPTGSVHCVIRGASNYKQTGLLQAFAAYHLVHGTPRRVGFASGCQAFGHRELHAVLQTFGLSGPARVTGDVAPVQLAPVPQAIGAVGARAAVPA